MSIKDLQTHVDESDLLAVKESLRIDEDDDKSLLESLIKTARIDIMGQVGEEIDDFFDDNPVFNSAVLVEVSHLYNHRDSVSYQQAYEVPMVFYSLINSMKDDYRYKLMLQEQSKEQSEPDKANDSAGQTDA